MHALLAVSMPNILLVYFDLYAKTTSLYKGHYEVALAWPFNTGLTVFFTRIHNYQLWYCRKDVLSEDRVHGDPEEADLSNFLHPVLYYYSTPPKPSEFS